MRRKICCAKRYAAPNGMTEVQKITRMPRIARAQEKTQIRILKNSHRVGRQHGSRNHHNIAIPKSTTTIPSVMISPCFVAGSLARAIRGISVRKGSRRKPLAIARTGEKRDGGQGSTVTVGRWVRGRPHAAGGVIVTAAWNWPSLG